MLVLLFFVFFLLGLRLHVQEKRFGPWGMTVPSASIYFDFSPSHRALNSPKLKLMMRRPCFDVWYVNLTTRVSCVACFIIFDMNWANLTECWGSSTYHQIGCLGDPDACNMHQRTICSRLMNRTIEPCLHLGYSFSWRALCKYIYMPN